MKKTMRFQPDANHIITQMPKTQFKKGEIVNVQPGYDALIITKEATAEVIQGKLEFKLEYPAEIIYLVKSNRTIYVTKWGTKSRIQVEDLQQKVQELGAFGTIEYQLINPHRFIQKRLNSSTEITEDQVKTMVLDVLPEAISHWTLNAKPIDSINPMSLMSEFKTKIGDKLNELCNEFGMTITKFNVESINLLNEERNLI
jgi:membrane protease subunit (stomatin/prohibitin family)